MLLAFNGFAARISAWCYGQQAWISLLSLSLLTVLSLLVTGALSHAKGEDAIRYSIRPPPQLQNDYQWKAAEIDSGSDNVEEAGPCCCLVCGV